MNTPAGDVSNPEHDDDCKRQDERVQYSGSREGLTTTSGRSSASGAGGTSGDAAFTAERGPELSMKLWIICVSLLLPAVGFACQFEERSKCEAQILRLLAYRNEAIEGAFGDLSSAIPEQLQVKFVSMKDPEHDQMHGSMFYDPERKLLLIPRQVAGADLPNPLRWTAYYWPYYQDERAREAFPVVEAIDDALWSAFLQEAARSRGYTWPHRNCYAADLDSRLPCRMLLSAAARFVKMPGAPLFNENRLDRIWPDDFVAFQQRNYRFDDPAYADVQRFGGILLLRPLIGEFGVPSVLAYVAQTPLVVDDNSLRISALRYQERARDVLRTRTELAHRSDQQVVSLSATAAVTAAAASNPTYR